MMIKNALMVKQIYGDTALSLTAKSGESLIIKDVLVFNPATNYATFKTDKTTVGYFRVGGNLGNHLPIPYGSASHSHGLKIAAADGSLTEDHAVTDGMGVSQASVGIFSNVSSLTTIDNFVQMGAIPSVGYESLLKYLDKLDIFKGFPIAEGETFNISGVNQASSLQLVIYEKWDSGDYKSTDANGSASKDYMFINYGRVSAPVTSSTSTLLETVQTPAEFPNFPYGEVCPAKTRMTIHGILASDVVDDLSGNDTMNTDYIKLIKGRETLFDDDKNGLLMKGIIGKTDAAAMIARGLSLIGNKSDVDIKPPFMFNPALEFGDGDELNIYISTTAGASQSSSDLLAADMEVGLIISVIREG